MLAGCASQPQGQEEGNPTTEGPQIPTTQAPEPLTFHGYVCTIDCSGHEAVMNGPKNMVLQSRTIVAVIRSLSSKDARHMPRSMEVAIVTKTKWMIIHSRGFRVRVSHFG